jgi:transcriptional regulator with XRE-family HTH domain
MPIPPHRRAFGERVRELRQQLGMSQEAFAHTAGFDRTYISGIERGIRNPTIDVVYRLADALGCPVTRLFADDGQQPATR